MKISKTLFSFLFLILTGCSSNSIQNEFQKTQVMQTALSAARTKMAITPELTLKPTIQITNTLIPTKTNNEYCNPDDASKAIIRLKEIYDVPENPTPAPQSTQDPNYKITEAQRLLMIVEIEKRIIQIDQMNPPDCLKPAVIHLRNSYIGMKDLFTPKEGRTNSDIIGIMLTSGNEQQLFKDELNKIQACLPTGCPLY